MDSLPTVLTEMFLFGEVKEVFYDTNDFLIDRNHSGVLCRLCYTADHLTRSKVLYHPAVITKKLGEIQSCMDAQRVKKTKDFEYANNIIEINNHYENKIIDMVSQVINVEGLTRVDIMLRATLEMSEKQNAPMLSTFYRCRFQNDTKMEIILPNKGNKIQVYAKEVDKK